jgi:cysteine protease ATG4
MIFSIVDELPSWSDVDDSLKSMSEPKEEEEEEEEEDMPEDEDDSLRSAVRDGEVHMKEGEGEGEKEEQEDDEEEEEEDSDGDFFDAGEGAVVDDRVSSHAASKSGQGEDTEDDPVGPMTPGPITTPTIVTNSTPVKMTPSGKSHAVSFAGTVSASTEGETSLVIHVLRYLI